MNDETNFGDPDGSVSLWSFVGCTRGAVSRRIECGGGAFEVGGRAYLMLVTWIPRARAALHTAEPVDGKTLVRTRRGGTTCR